MKNHNIDFRIAIHPKYPETMLEKKECLKQFIGKRITIKNHGPEKVLSFWNPSTFRLHTTFHIFTQRLSGPTKGKLLSVAVSQKSAAKCFLSALTGVYSIAGRFVGRLIRLVFSHFVTV